MFTKRVKLIRDMIQEKEILDKKIKREVSKFSDNLENEIKKKFKRANPGIQIKIERIEDWHFVEKKNRKNPLLILVESFNGRHVHEDNFWVFPSEIEDNEWLRTENEVSLDDFFLKLRELSEELGVYFDVRVVSGKITGVK